jgi:hypothetical protein
VVDVVYVVVEVDGKILVESDYEIHQLDSFVVVEFSLRPSTYSRCDWIKVDF